MSLSIRVIKGKMELTECDSYGSFFSLRNKLKSTDSSYNFNSLLRLIIYLYGTFHTRTAV